MFRPILLIVFTMTAVISMRIEALSTICSNPARARVLASATIRLPTDNIRALDRRFEILAPKVGMTIWGTALSDSKGSVETRTLGLQSPKVSVSIEARWRPGQKAAELDVERTCINDALEPWRGYWWELIRGLEDAGYAVVSSPTRKVH